MKLSVVIINFNTFKLTCECIDSLYKQNFAFDYEVILVDNNSTECNPDDFQKLFPQLVLIKSSENSGFARGNNMGMAVAKGEYILVLNSDTIVHKGAIEYCLEYFDSPVTGKNIGVLSCKLRYGNGDIQLSSFNHQFWLSEALLDNPIVSFLTNKLGYGRRESVDDRLAKQQTSHETQAVLGACMLCRKEVVDKVGMMDPDFFMYYEELEWCYRFSKAGYRIVYVADVYITHLEGGTNGAKFNSDDLNKVSIKRKEQPILSKMLFIYKEAGRMGYSLYNGIKFINILTQAVISPFRNSEWQVSREQYLYNYKLSKKYESVMFKYFKPEFASAEFPFKTSIADELMKK